MRLKLLSLIVFCPLVLSYLCSVDSRQSYYLEDIADEYVDDDGYYDDQIADDDAYEDSSMTSPGSIDQSGISYKSPRIRDCENPFDVMRAGVRHTEARGVGYQNGYTTLEGFGIYDRNNSFMPFLDVRGHVFDSGKFAGNVGIGERTALFSISHILGVYCYYDVREASHGLTVNQVSPGIELLGSRMEYRLNGYFPVGKTKSHHYDSSFDKFDGHHIIVKSKQREALTGGDTEVGVHITQSTKYDLYAGVGSYYFGSSDVSAWGGKVRLLGRYKQYVSLEASYSYDRLFKNVVQGTVAFNLPFGGKLKQRDKNCSEQSSLWFSRAAFAPQRFEIPVVKKVKQRKRAINPATHKPWQVWFVNNTSSSDGTFQSPFPTLAQAQNASKSGDVIYVFPGNGTTSGMDLGITLKSEQKLFGSAIEHRIRTTYGKIMIPKFSSSNPTITASSGNVVNLNNGNEVAGMNILMNSPGMNTAAGIGTSLASISGVDIKNNNISVITTQNGINLNASGDVDISFNQLTSTNPDAPLGIVVFKTGPLQEKITYNNVSGFEFCIGADGNFNGAPSEVVIKGNTVSNFLGFGIVGSKDLASSRISILENTVINDRTDFPSVGITCQDVTECIVQGNQINYLNAAFPVIGIVIDTVTNSVIDSNQVTFAQGLPDVIGITCGPGTSTGIHYTTVVSNNSVVLGGAAVDVGFGITADGGDSVCASIIGNVVTSPAPGTTAFDLATTGSGDLNIQVFKGNIGSIVNTSNTSTGMVNLVSPESCSN